MELIWRNAVLVPWLASCGHGRRVPSGGSSQLSYSVPSPHVISTCLARPKELVNFLFLSTMNINQYLSHDNPRNTSTTSFARYKIHLGQTFLL